MNPFQALVGTVVKMYLILLPHSTQIFSDMCPLDVLGCGFGSVSCQLPAQKKLFLKRAPVSRGNYLVTGLIVRRFVDHFRGSLFTFHLDCHDVCPVWYVILLMVPVKLTYFRSCKGTAIGTGVLSDY